MDEVTLIVMMNGIRQHGLLQREVLEQRMDGID